MSAESGQPPPLDLSLKGARVVSLGSGHQLLVLNQPEQESPSQQRWLTSDCQPMVLTPVRGQLLGESVYTAAQSTDGLKRVLTMDDAPAGPMLPSHSAAAAAWKLEDDQLLQRHHHQQQQQLMLQQQQQSQQLGNAAALPSWWQEALPGDLSRRLNLEDCHRRASAGFSTEERARFGQSYRKACARLTPKERNRLAQKRFRDRQKALIASLQCKVEDLSTLVRQYQLQTAELQRERLDMVAELRKRGVAWPSRHG